MTETKSQLLILFFWVLGLGLGSGQFLSLHAIVRGYVAGRSHPRVFVLHAVRVALIASAWVAITRIGGARSLLAAFVGFLISRPLVMVCTRRAAS